MRGALLFVVMVDASLCFVLNFEGNGHKPKRTAMSKPQYHFAARISVGFGLLMVGFCTLSDSPRWGTVVFGAILVLASITLAILSKE